MKANGSVDASNPIRRGLDALLQTIFDDNMASTREALEWLNELLMQHMPARGWMDAKLPDQNRLNRTLLKEKLEDFPESSS